MKIKWIHALAAGTHPSTSGSVTITLDMLEQLASSYDAVHHEAPVVIGHPDNDDPAWGWVKETQLRPDGLWLGVDLTPEMLALVEQKRYKKVSVSIYPPAHEANPTPGVYALKHLGFLGATPPAVKGLQAIGLSSDAASGVLTINVSTPKEKSMDPEEIAAKEAELAQKEQTINLSEKTLNQREQIIAQREKELQKQTLESKIQPLVQSGRVLPHQKDLVLSLAEHVDGKTINLSEGGKSQDKPLLDAFVSFLEGLPAQVPVGDERASAITAPKAPAAPVSFNAPAGYEVNAADALLYEEVKAYQKEHVGATIVEAIHAIKGAQ